MISTKFHTIGLDFHMGLIYTKRMDAKFHVGFCSEIPLKILLSIYSNCPRRAFVPFADNLSNTNNSLHNILMMYKNETALML